ncbi:TRAP transporter substrate-binding protein DctP [Amorphus orientalis]|uniref:TRAP-type C4-dicarboxylate transport system substrate-binding protein n=1 Tax=Amorphus orientalis TaxID=649198 RepID=A0AAE4AU00_9HYPH|nr:TRAP transporter substrate-binding protein DctP [Amorphus orientalis]MDQ0316647.1 TRAP-type C4-dicarboxylate transport system substrate-binding protein [Amorphus orientalis]
MKRVLVCAALMAGTALSAHAEEVTLRGASAFASGTTFDRPFQAFVEWINENGEGVLQINVVGGPEAVPPFEVGNAVSSGVIDIANVTAAFYTNLLPEGDALKLATNTIQDQRENGCYELVDQLHQEAMNVKYLGRTGDGIPFHLYLTKPIDSADLSGLTIRTTPVYQAMFESLGGNLVRTAPGEVYTALERGTIDGYGWPAQGVLDLGWDEQTKYRVDPGFYQVDVDLIMNLDTWNELGEEQKYLLQRGIKWIETRNAENEQINAEEREKQAQAGIETITLEGEEREKWLTAAQEEGWAAIEKIDAENAEKLRACLTD